MSFQFNSEYDQSEVTHLVLRDQFTGNVWVAEGSVEIPVCNPHLQMCNAMLCVCCVYSVLLDPIMLLLT